MVISEQRNERIKVSSVENEMNANKMKNLSQFVIIGNWLPDILAKFSKGVGFQKLLGADPLSWKQPGHPKSLRTHAQGQYFQ